MKKTLFLSLLALSTLAIARTADAVLYRLRSAHRISRVAIFSRMASPFSLPVLAISGDVDPDRPA